MAAGLGFKDFTTGEVLTAADVDGYLMQGVWVFASAAARDAAVTSPQEGNFAYLKDTNVTTYYTGSAWANLDTTGMTNPMTTTGDTIYSSSGSTPARLGIGSTGQVLTVAGGVPTWATPAASGSMTLLSTTSLSGSSVTLSSISGSYKDLILRFIDYKKSDDAATLSMQVNADTGSNYNSGGYGFYGSTVSALYVQGAHTSIILSRWTPDDGTNDFFQEVKITDYSNSTTYKMVESKNIAIQNDSASNYGFSYMSGLFFGSTSAITEVKTSLSSGTFTGGSVLLYGVN